MNDPAFEPVTLIIPNFNGAALLAENLPSVLEAARQYPGGCTVLVVDDGSRDGSVEAVETRYPTVRLLRHPENRGFAEAIHTGVDAAETELLVFLNSDVRPEPGFLVPLVRLMGDSEVFSVSPLVVDPEGRIGAESWRCYEIRRGRLRAVKSAGHTFSGPMKTLYNSGGSMLVRKSRFLELGGFSPIFKPFYSEDSDLGIRAWRRGWSNLLEPACRVVHDHSGSSIDSNVARARVRTIRRRNQFLLEWINLPMRDIWLALVPGYLIQAMGRLLRGDRVYFAGLAAALTRLPEVRRQRAAVQETAVRDFWGIMADIRRSADNGR